MKIGHKLLTIRQDRKMTQNEMAELIGYSDSAYGRLERGITSVEMEQVVDFAKKLDLPFQDFLPETIAFNNNSENGQVGFVMGNFYSYGDKEASLENKSLREKIELLEDKINHLEEIISILKKE
ncbi:MAG: transcriptional regulator with XRE-family HTH domain [Flammeovirgaceae bacterium]|jgi:transcriptional regulator with XRE-family HTH domain